MKVEAACLEREEAEGDSGGMQTRWVAAGAGANWVAEGSGWSEDAAGSGLGEPGFRLVVKVVAVAKARWMPGRWG